MGRLIRDTLVLVLVAACVPSCKEYRRCARISSAGKGSVAAGSVTCSWKGHAGSCAPGPGETLDLCVAAGFAADPGTRAGVEAFLDACGKGKADAVVALGDLGLDEDGIESTLKLLAGAGVPVLALPGSSEPYGGWLDAVEKVQDAGGPVVDLSRVRVLAWGGEALVGMPGIPNPRYLAHPGKGCGFDERDMDDLADLVEEGKEKGRVVVLSSYPPRGKIVDASREGVAIGDPGLAGILEATGVLFGAFGSVYEAGGIGVDPADGSREDQGAWHKALFVNPGSIEAVPWEGGGGFSMGQAVMIQLGERGARFSVWRRM